MIFISCSVCDVSFKLVTTIIPRIKKRYCTCVSLKHASQTRKTIQSLYFYDIVSYKFSLVAVREAAKKGLFLVDSPLRPLAPPPPFGLVVKRTATNLIIKKDIKKNI